MSLYLDLNKTITQFIALFLMTLILGAIVALIVSVGSIWAVNQLFDIKIEYNIPNIIAAIILFLYFKGGVTIETKK